MKSRESTRKVWVYESLRREGKIRDLANYPTAISYLFHLRAVYNEPSIIFIALRPPPLSELFERHGRHCTELEDGETNTHISIFFLRKISSSHTQFALRLRSARKNANKSYSSRYTLLRSDLLFDATTYRFSYRTLVFMIITAIISRMNSVMSWLSPLADNIPL